MYIGSLRAEEEDLTERMRIAAVERDQRRRDAKEEKRREEEAKKRREEAEKKEDDELSQLHELAERNAATFKQQYDRHQAVCVYHRREQDVIMTDEEVKLDGKGKVKKKVGWDVDEKWEAKREREREGYRKPKRVILLGPP